MPNALSATTHTIYSGLGQAPNNDGLNNRWLDTYTYHLTALVVGYIMHVKLSIN